MKFFSLIALFLVLGIAAFSAGCSSAGKADTPRTAPPTPAPPTNITYNNHGFSFMYPDNLRLTESETSDSKPGTWKSGDVNLKGESDNITVSWMAMSHIPPNIPVLYESLRSSFQKDPKLSDVKFYLLETYPNTTCGDATFIGHVSFYDKVRNTQTYEGIIFWYHPRQDRTYFIDMASGNEFKPYIRETLAGYQQSFNCTDS